MIESGDIAGAEQNLRLALKLNPNCAETLIGLGRVRCAQMRFPEACILFRRAVRLAADDDVRLRAKALCDYYLGYPLRASKKLIRFVSKSVKRTRRRLLEDRIGIGE